MRQIFLDTETTGLSFVNGDRIIEIGCVEMVNRRLTGNNFHYYINPQRTVSEEALSVHGLSNEFLNDKPLFEAVADEFFSYVKGSELIAHNASFDIGFLDFELHLVHPTFKKLEEECEIFDTLVLARQMHPGLRNSLDALTKRYKIDHFNRELHGALLDAEILAQVYLAMTGGQGSLFRESSDSQATKKQIDAVQQQSYTTRKPLRIIAADTDEKKAHQKLLELINKESDGQCLWKD